MVQTISSRDCVPAAPSLVSRERLALGRLQFRQEHVCVATQSCTSEVAGRKFEDARLMVREECVSITLLCVTAGGLAGLYEGLVETDDKVEAFLFTLCDDCMYNRVLKTVPPSNAECLHVVISLEDDE